MHPVFTAMEQSEHAWLVATVRAFNQGDIDKYQQIIQENKEKFAQLVCPPFYWNVFQCNDPHLIPPVEYFCAQGNLFGGENYDFSFDEFHLQTLFRQAHYHLPTGGFGHSFA